jgi:hypothetical protein
LCFLASSQWQPNCIEFLYIETRLKPPLSKYFYLTTMKTSTFVKVHTNNEQELNVSREKNSLSLKRENSQYHHGEHSNQCKHVGRKQNDVDVNTKYCKVKRCPQFLPSFEQNSHNSDSKIRGFLAFQTCNINSFLVQMRLIFYFVNGHLILAFIA